MRGDATLRAVALVGAVGLLVAGVVGGVASAPAEAASSCRTVPVPQDAELRSDLARADFGVDGTGVTVGIISNTFAQNTTGPDTSTPAQNVADGLLPGPGNPCGYLTPVEVLLEGPAGSDDEGRAMAQIVHGVAPGATIVFASAKSAGGSQGMIDAIDAIAAADPDIVVDDMTLPTEPWFQESLVSQRIDELVASGVTYFSAAGNETVIAQNPRPGQEATPVNGWSTDAYRPMACPADVLAQLTYTSADCMNFSLSGADATSDYIVDLAALITPPDPTASLDFALQWAEPWKNAQAQFTFVTRITGSGSNVWQVADTLTDTPFATDTVTIDTDDYGATATIEFSIARDLGSAQIRPAVAFLGLMDGLTWIDSAEYWRSNEHDTVGRTVLGHNGGPSVISVAATGVGDDDRIEYYSSLGPVVYLLEPETATGTEAALAAPQLLSKPTLLSVDAIPNTAMGDPSTTPGVLVFSGTSAATPNAGAVAALALQLDPSLSPARLTELLMRTAQPQPAPYAGVSVEHSVGAGLIDAYALLREVAPRPQLARTGGEALWPLGLGVLLLGVGLALQVRRRVRRG